MIGCTKVEQEAEHKTQQVMLLVSILTICWFIRSLNLFYQPILANFTLKTLQYRMCSSMSVHGQWKCTRCKCNIIRVRTPFRVNIPTETCFCETLMMKSSSKFCMQVMLQLGISRIPDRHIMIRWTRLARDIIPKEINFCHADSAAMPSLIYCHRFNYTYSIKKLTKMNHLYSSWADGVVGSVVSVVKYQLRLNMSAAKREH